MISTMPAVSDTSPILGLAAIGKLELLQQQFGAVLIPPAVLAELKVETNFRGTTAIRAALEAGWLELCEVQNRRLVQTLAIELDPGEAEAIALAIELEYPVLVMDEHDGRAKARALGLKPVGILGILLLAKKNGQIKSIKTTMQALRREIGFFISDDLYRQILKQAGE